MTDLTSLSKTFGRTVQWIESYSDFDEFYETRGPNRYTLNFTDGSKLVISAELCECIPHPTIQFKEANGS